MSNPSKVSFHEFFSRIGHAYSSVDVRHTLLREGEKWRNVITVVRFSERGLEEVKARHASLQSRLGKILTKDFTIILQALSIEEWEELRYEMAIGDVCSVPGFQKGITFEACQNLDNRTGQIWPYTYLPEYEGWHVLEIRLAQQVMAEKLATFEPQVRGAGFSDVYSTISSFLEMPYGRSDPSHLVVVAPTLVRCHIDSLNFDTKELKVTTEIHDKLSNCQLIVLVKKNGNMPVQGRPVSLRRSVLLDPTKGVQSENDFQLISSKVTLSDFEGKDELELMIMADSTLLFGITEPPGKYLKGRLSDVRGIEFPDLTMPVGGASDPDRRRVFVVYGRNEKLRQDIFNFLRALGLNPMEWSEAVALTGKATPYTGEVLDAAFRKARAVIVLLSPDDEARLLEKFAKSNDPDSEKQLNPQPRPNVLFEAGFAFGSKPDRTILVKLGNLRPISDIHGRNEVRLTNDPSTRKELVSRLQVAGCEVNLSGSDWLKIGNFDLIRPLPKPKEKIESISMEEAKLITLDHVRQERPESKDALIDTVQLIGKNWCVSGHWTESRPKSFGTTNFDIVINSETKQITKSDFKGGFAMSSFR